jgi:agmatine deiminase
LGTTPQAEGFRWPAEWEPHRATWLAWPHNEETWPGRLEAVVASFVEMVRVLHGGEQVCITVLDAAMEEAARGRLSRAGIETGLEFHHFPTNDAWIRDHGPLFVTTGSEVAVVDFRFDAWGRKYPPWDLDDRIPQAVAAVRRIRRFGVEAVLEGGSVDGNGCGSVLTTESCLLNPNRGPVRSSCRGASRIREALEHLLHDTLGATNVLWLAGGIEGDDTDGHVDDLCRFVDCSTVVAAWEGNPRDPNHAPLSENLRRLREMRDQDGKPLAVATLPMPPPLRIAGLRRPASYANFYLANGVALVPVFEVPSDARALAVLRELLPGRDVVPIPARELVVGLGAVHCLTQQEPAHLSPVDHRQSPPRGLPSV